jgi:hypothetical protein
MFCQNLQAVILGQNITDMSRKDALIKNLLCRDSLRPLKNVEGSSGQQSDPAYDKCM